MGDLQRGIAEADDFARPRGTGIEPEQQGGQGDIHPVETNDRPRADKIHQGGNVKRARRHGGKHTEQRLA